LIILFSSADIFPKIWNLRRGALGKIPQYQEKFVFSQLLLPFY